MTATVLACALIVALGVVGVLVPFLPGPLLVAAGVAVWATEVQSTRGWVVLAVVLAVLLLGSVAEWVLPGRGLQRAGVPNRSILTGGLLGVIGFFVLPVVGLPIGFVLGIYLAERARVHGHASAWRATVSALRAMGFQVLIELASVCVAAAVWTLAVVTA